MNNSIADYIATLQFRPDVSSLRNVDRFLRIIERKVDRSARRIATRYPLSGLGAAAAGGHGGSIGYGYGGNHHPNFPSVPSVNSHHAGQMAPRPPTFSQNMSTMRNMGTVAGATVAGFGLGALNDTLQRLELLPVALQSVTGSAEKAAEQLDFISKLGHEVGATRLELAPEYTKMLASAVGTKMEAEMPRIFTALTKYGKVMGLDQDQMKGSFKAVSQMINKQQIMAEELKGQLAERLPAAIRIMADAITGGDTKKLFAMMKAGKLDPNTALPKFATELEARAAGGWGNYLKTQRAQQNFSRVAFEDQMINFGKSGGNEAFFRIWKAFADNLPKMNGLVKALAGAFVGLAKVVEGLGTMLAGLSRAFDWFYGLPEDVQYLGQVAGSVFALMAIQAGILGKAMARAFLPLTTAYILLEDIAYGIAGKDSITKRVMDYFSGGDTTLNKIATVGNTLNPAGMIASLALGTFTKHKTNNLFSQAANMQASASADRMASASSDAFGQSISMSIDVSGATGDDEALAKKISDQLSSTLKPLMFSKAPVE